jgi:RNA polymerase sigma factor (sigma-70 family)
VHSADHDTIATVWRLESARIVAAVARRVRDVGVAEELAQDALVAALERWPLDGLPDKPAAWLMTTALNRALDHLRHRQMADARHGDIAADLQALEAHVVPDFSDSLDRQREDAVLGDDLLRLIFTACHPVLPPESRVALTLKLLGGLSTAEIARAYLVPEATLAQRIVRAKRTLADAQVPFELPPPEQLGERLGSVLEVVYLVFNEGYTATSGADWMRPALCDEALRLGRMLAGLAPQEAEVLGLLALMEIQASRTAARTDREGQPVLLADQDRRCWDRLLIRRGLAALDRAQALGQSPGRYRLQAQIAACHARAPRADDTDWSQIAALYAELMRVAPSPVVELNRAVAVGMAEGPAAGLAVVESLLQDKALARYHWLPAVQGDLLEKLGRHDEARAAFLRAASSASNEREQALLQARAEAYR